MARKRSLSSNAKIRQWLDQIATLSEADRVAIAYNLGDILDAMDTLSQKLHGAIDHPQRPRPLNRQELQELIAILRVWLYDEIQRHMKGLKAPLRRLADAAYEGEESEDVEEVAGRRA